MGKHDMKIIESSEEFVKNENRNLRKKLAEKDAEIAFANETVKRLQEQCSRMSRWASEVEANAQDQLDNLAKENTMLREKIAKLVELYV